MFAHNRNEQKSIFPFFWVMFYFIYIYIYHHTILVEWYRNSLWIQIWNKAIHHVNNLITWVYISSAKNLYYLLCILLLGCCLGTTWLSWSRPGGKKWQDREQISWAVLCLFFRLPLVSIFASSLTCRVFIGSEVTVKWWLVKAVKHDREWKGQMK